MFYAVDKNLCGCPHGSQVTEYIRTGRSGQRKVSGCKYWSFEGHAAFWPQTTLHRNRR